MKNAVSSSETSINIYQNLHNAENWKKLKSHSEANFIKTERDRRKKVNQSPKRRSVATCIYKVNDIYLKIKVGPEKGSGDVEWRLRTGSYGNDVYTYIHP